MCCTYQVLGIPPKKHSALRLLAIIFCAAYIIVSIFGAASLLSHLDHEHDQDGLNGSCAACAHIIAAGNILKQISTGVTSAVIAIVGLLISVFLYRSQSLQIRLFTPVTLKVKLNN